MTSSCVMNKKGYEKSFKAIIYKEPNRESVFFVFFFKKSKTQYI